MAIVVGLDFGTHQTKICIENSDIPLHKTYEFYEWEKGVYAFPSIIQINKDHTLRYGSIDLDTCLVARKKKFIDNPKEVALPPQPVKPKIPIVKEPKMPSQLVHTFVTDGGIPMSIPYSVLCTDPKFKASPKQKAEYNIWLDKCSSLKRQYKQLLEQRNRIVAQYKKDLQDWEKECERIRNSINGRIKQYEESLVEYPMIYRYFKQATFSSYPWDYEIKASDLTVLYLAFVIFRLEERFGINFSIQMGIPASKDGFNRLKSFASGYLIQAIRLVEDVFQNDFEKFLATPYEELLMMVPKYEYSVDLKEQYGLIILPEAYAALRSLTANSRIPKGMSIILDMGGGTTDISFFVIEDNGEPHIYHFESIAKGLNFFLEYEDRHSARVIDFSKKKELEDIPKDVFNKAFIEFKDNIDKVIKNLTNFLHHDTITRGFMKSAFIDAIQNRPAIYTGGGCYDRRMRKSIFYFTDVNYINKQLLGIKNIVDEKNVTIPYSLMATAFGLSIQSENDEIEVSEKEELFKRFSKMSEQDLHWKAHREHGMTDD